VFLALRQLAQPAGYRVHLSGPAQPYQRLDQIAGDGKGPGIGYALAQGVLPDPAKGISRPFGLMGEQRGDPARPHHLQLVPPVPEVAVD